MIANSISIPMLTRPAATDIVTSGLVMHLDARNVASYQGSGTTWTDLSGAGNHGTFTATPSVSNGVVSLSGSYHVTTTNQFANPQSFSVEVWFRTNSASGRKLIGLENAQTGSVVVWDRHYYIDTSGNLRFAVFSGDQNTVNYGFVADNSWRCAAVSYNAGIANHYLNAALLETRTATAASYSGWWRVFGFSNAGYAGGGADGGFIGEGAIVRIYNRPMAAAEWEQNFNTNRAWFGI